MLMIAVGAIIQDNDGRILLVKHIPERGGFWQKKWICPGGELQSEETVEEGIKREVKEETQLDIELTTPLPPFGTIFRLSEKDILHVVYVDYIARLTGGKLKPGSDIGEAIWLEKERLPSIWDDLHEDTKRLLQIAKIVGNVN